MSAGWCQYTAEEEESLFTAMSIGLNSRTGQLDTSSEHPKWNLHSSEQAVDGCLDSNDLSSAFVNAGVLFRACQKSTIGRALGDGATNSKPCRENVWRSAAVTVRGMCIPNCGNRHNQAAIQLDFGR